MAEFAVFRLRPRGAFHFGVQGVGLEETGERCPSDTLWSALLMEAELGKLGWFPKPDDHGALLDPPFRLSSCFPYVGDVLLFPRPRLQPTNRRERQPDDAGARKKDKKVRYVSRPVLDHLLSGGALSEYPNAATMQDGAVMIDKKEASAPQDRIWAEQRVDRVAVDRATQGSNLFAVGQVRFAKDCGLYVMAQCRSEDDRSQLRALLTRLGHAGLGGKRSGGLGQFDVCCSDTSVTFSDPTSRAMLLSRYLPTPQELDNSVLGPTASYDLATVGGWLQTNAGVATQQRRTIRLLSEGSVVQCIDGQPPQGCAVDLRPTDWHTQHHPVWRYGLALSIGVEAT
jgi:CRISPR-associated protein Csm4